MVYFKYGINVMYSPVIIAVVITPTMLAPKASGNTMALGFTLLTSFCTTFAVLGTQLTPAIPMVGLNLPRFMKNIT